MTVLTLFSALSFVSGSGHAIPRVLFETQLFSTVRSTVHVSPLPWSFSKMLFKPGRRRTFEYRASKKWSHENFVISLPISFSQTQSQKKRWLLLFINVGLGRQLPTTLRAVGFSYTFGVGETNCSQGNYTQNVRFCGFNGLHCGPWYAHNRTKSWIDLSLFDN